MRTTGTAALELVPPAARVRALAFTTAYEIVVDAFLNSAVDADSTRPCYRRHLLRLFAQLGVDTVAELSGASKVKRSPTRVYPPPPWTSNPRWLERSSLTNRSTGPCASDSPVGIRPCPGRKNERLAGSPMKTANDHFIAAILCRSRPAAASRARAVCERERGATARGIPDVRLAALRQLLHLSRRHRLELRECHEPEPPSQWAAVVTAGVVDASLVRVIPTCPGAARLAVPTFRGAPAAGGRLARVHFASLNAAISTTLPCETSAKALGRHRSPEEPPSSIPCWPVPGSPCRACS